MMKEDIPPETAKPVSALSGPQQDVVASLVLRDFHRQEKLRKQARGYPGDDFVSFIPSVIIFGLIMGRPDGWKLVGGAFVVTIALIHFHVRGINRRIDALMKLGAGKESEDAKRAVDPVAGRD